MKAIATTLAAMLAVALAAAAFAQETTIQVPQGSGVLPTIGQVNCLEEMGSGRLCAATYECSGESGRLWGDLANHDGRRAIGEDSPVARGRDCTVTVDGRAAVRWLTGYSPGGRTGELVGLTTSEDALRPVVRGGSTSTGEGNDRVLLDYVLEVADTTLADERDRLCGHIQAGHTDHDACVTERVRPVINKAAGLLLLPDTPLTRCLVQAKVKAYSDGSVSCVLDQAYYCARGEPHDVSLLHYLVDQGWFRRGGDTHQSYLGSSRGWDCRSEYEEALRLRGMRFYAPDHTLD